MSARMRKVGGGRGQLAPGEEDALQLQTASRKAGLFKAQGRGWRGGGREKPKNDNPERRAEFGALLPCCRSPLRLSSFASPPQHPLPQTSHARACSSFPSPPLPPPKLEKKKKKKLSGSHSTCGPEVCWRGGRGAGTAAGAASYLVKFVLPSEWTQAPGAAGGDAGLARSLRLAPARRAWLAPRPPPPSRARSGPPTPTTASFQYGILSVRMPGTLF